MEKDENDQLKEKQERKAKQKQIAAGIMEQISINVSNTALNFLDRASEVVDS